MIEDSEAQPLAEVSEFLGIQTNNYAEYNGLLAALDFAITSREPNLRVLSDSELMVKQIKGQYKVSSPALKELYDRAKKMIAKLEWFSIEHVRRERNKEADALANEAMDRRRPGRVLRRADEAKPLAAESVSPAIESSQAPQPPRATASTREYRGIVRDGRIELIERLPDGTRVLVKVID